MKQQEIKKAEKETEEIERVIKKSDSKPDAQIEIIKVISSVTARRLNPFQG